MKSVTSDHFGGRPVKSNVARRMRCCFVAGLDRSRPFSRNLGTTNLSMSVSCRFGSESSGASKSRVGRNAQCRSYFAPLSIQWRSRRISCSLNDLASPGGMRKSESSEVTRAMSSLSSGWFGSIADSFAEASISSRRSASRCSSSGPWH